MHSCVAHFTNTEPAAGCHLLHNARCEYQPQMEFPGKLCVCVYVLRVLVFDVMCCCFVLINKTGHRHLAMHRDHDHSVVQSDSTISLSAAQARHRLGDDGAARVPMVSPRRSLAVR